MKKALFILALSCFSCLLNAQEKQDSVTIRLETSAGAEIGIDGDISSTNILHKKVAMGKHVVTVKFGSSFMKEYELEVNPGDEHTYRYPINGKVDIQTTPAGASVFIDGLPQGKAPLAVEMLGDHNIRIEADPLVYYDLTERISVNPFENLTRNFTLAKRPPRLYGMAMANGRRHIDNHTVVRHAAKGGRTDELFKYVLDENSVGSFSGLIQVCPGAEKTEAYQSNKNICASEGARMYSKPQLIIDCDDVKCSHGSSTGQLDQQALFYMRQRGIPEHEARLMLMQAFMNDVIAGVRMEALKDRLRHLVESRFAGNNSASCRSCSSTCHKQ